MIDILRLLNVCKFVDNETKFELNDIKSISNINLKRRNVCIFMHGTSGFSKNCINYMKMLHKLGFFIIAPHHVSYHHYLCNIHKKKKICGQDIKYTTTNYFAKRHKLLYSYIAYFRKLEVEYCFGYFKKKLNLKNTILLGVSEGAIAVSLCRISGITKFICSYSIERNYFTQKFPVIFTSKKQKIVQIIGTHDEFFGPESISSSLSNQIEGNGKCTFAKYKINNYHIYLLKGQTHSLLVTMRNCKLLSNIIYSHFGARQNRISPKLATLYFKISG